MPSLSAWCAREAPRRDHTACAALGVELKRPAPAHRASTGRAVPPHSLHRPGSSGCGPAYGGKRQRTVRHRRTQSPDAVAHRPHRFSSRRVVQPELPLTLQFARDGLYATLTRPVISAPQSQTNSVRCVAPARSDARQRAGQPSQKIEPLQSCLFVASKPSSAAGSSTPRAVSEPVHWSRPLAPGRAAAAQTQSGPDVSVPTKAQYPGCFITESTAYRNMHLRFGLARLDRLTPNHYPLQGVVLVGILPRTVFFLVDDGGADDGGDLEGGSAQLRLGKATRGRRYS